MKVREATDIFPPLEPETTTSSPTSDTPVLTASPLMVIPPRPADSSSTVILPLFQLFTMPTALPAASAVATAPATRISEVNSRVIMSPSLNLARLS